jgi:hypothetical protein
MAGGIEAGLMRQRVTLIRPTTVTDSFGQCSWHMDRCCRRVGRKWSNGGGGTSLTANRTLNHLPA